MTVPVGYAYSDDTRAEAVALARSGLTDKAVGERVGVSPNTVRRWRMTAGVNKPPRRVLTDTEWADIRDLVENGETIVGIARTLDAPLKLITRAVHDLKPPSRHRLEIDEVEVMRRTRAGESARQIGEALGVSERTIERTKRRVHRFHVPTPKAPRNWIDRALCTGSSSLFDRATEGHMDAVAKAKAICSWCPVQADCIAWAIDTRIDGVLGGTTASERRGMGAA